MTSDKQDQATPPARPHDLFTLFYDEHQSLRGTDSREAADLYYWAADQMDGLFKGQDMGSWVDLYQRIIQGLGVQRGRLQNDATAIEACDAIAEIINEQIFLVVNFRMKGFRKQ